MFTAVAHEPLIIENRALGYKLHYILEKLEATFTSIKYAGVPRFVEMISTSTREKEKWRNNRQRVYNGSVRHFLSVLCASAADGQITRNSEGYLKKRGFYVYVVEDPFVKNPFAVRKIPIGDFFGKKLVLEPADHALGTLVEFS